MEVGGLYYICHPTIRTERRGGYGHAQGVFNCANLIARPIWWKEEGYYDNIPDIVYTIRLMDVQSVDESGAWNITVDSQISTKML